MEGLQLRSIKLWSKGEPIEEVYRIIENNTRFPLNCSATSRRTGWLSLGRDLTQAMAINMGSITFSAPRCHSRPVRGGYATKNSRDPGRRSTK